MKTSDLIPGQPYFMITFPDPQMRKPIIISYEFVEKATIEEGYVEEGFVFRYMPAFQYEMEDGEMFPDKEELTLLSAESIESLVDISGLISELQKIEHSAS